jgi:predicted ATPase/DNA-binding CsgD family transcriptional regulator
MTMRDPAYRADDLSTFIGRSAEIGELRDLLRTSRAVTLCGAGGIGKTRLATELLAAVADEYPDGAWLVELGEVRQPEQVVTWVAGAAGLQGEPGRPLLDTLADALRYRRAILVLDNCEHLIEECAALSQRLLASSPGLQMIATSREPLRVAAERVWQVPPLALPPAAAADAADLPTLRSFDAIRLFVARAAAAAPGFALGPANAAEVAAICRSLDGLPLAIELAAAWARVLSLGEIADRLASRLALLAKADRSVPARQQTLRATFDWSYALLSGPEQMLLRRLTVLATWSLDMAERVCADEELPAEQIVDLLTALADKSLVEVGPEALGQARYRMLATVRTYAANLLAQSGEASIMRRRMRDYTLREVERAADLGMARADASWSDLLAVFHRFDLEAANLTEVLSRCVADRDVETGLRICTSMRPVWIVRGAFADGAAWYDRLLALAGPDVPAAVRGRALSGRAQLALATGSEQAKDLATAGLELSREAGDDFWAAVALNLLAEIALHTGSAAEAEARAAEALEIARAAGDRWNEGYALGTVATVAASRGAILDARLLGEEALAIMLAIDQRWGCARTLLGLGDLARLQGEPDAAREYYLEALATLRELDARPDMARCLAGLGRIAMEQRDVAAAREYLAESLRLSYATGSRIGMARGLEALAGLSVLEDRPDVAIQLAGALAALREQAHLRPLPEARVRGILDPAVAGLWSQGMTMTTATAVRLALGPGEGEQSGTAKPPAAGSPVPSLAAPEADGLAADELASAGMPAAALTPRETEVVSLLAMDLSNREIASKLSIRPATAERHVANILAKLGVSSRSQVAAWAARRPRD